ncbi:MAG: two-component system sensor kinase FixL [Verrucomicrobiales bacterium]|jgi:two-component system sensor kinase FixL
MERQITTAESFREVIESVPSGLVIVDPEGKIALFNRQAEHIFGYSRGEINGQPMEVLLPERYRSAHVQMRQAYLKDARPRQMGSGRELFAQRKDGSEFPVEVGLNPVETPEGTMVLAAIVDISERKRAEQKVRHQAQLLQNVHDAVFLIAPDGTVLTWNPGATNVYGFLEDEMIGRNVRSIFPSGEKDRFTSRVYPTVSSEGSFEFVAKSIRSDGNEIYVAVRASAYHDPASDQPAVLICANDITVQKQLEQRTLDISEREQRRIGQDIHDDLCQQLAGIGCLAKVLEKQAGDLYQADATGLAQLGKMVTDANIRARGIARGLAPAIIETHGLEHALEDLASQSRIVYCIDCSFLAGEVVAEIPQTIAVQLFRIAQEATNNAVQHGKASAVTFYLEVTDEQILLSVRDNGNGTKENLSAKSDGLGLLSMRHRAEVLDGELTIEAGVSPETSGVHVTVTVPRKSTSHA